MFERLTHDARMTVVVAQNEARMLRDSSISTAHLLIGLAGTGDDAASRALRGAGMTAADLRSRLRRTVGAALDPAALATLGINLAAVRRATEERFGAGALDPQRRRPEPKGHIPFSPDAKRSLAVAVQTAASLHSRSISTGHLLIGILDGSSNLGATLLQDAGLDLIRLRSDVVALLGAEAA